jgi:hypothetical protein
MLSELIGRIEVGVSVQCDNRPKRDDEYGVLKTSAVGNGIFDPTQHKVALPEEISRLGVNVRSESIIICRSNTPELVGTSAFVANASPDLYLPDTLWQTADHNTSIVNVRWLAHYFSSMMFRAQIDSIASGTSANMKKISQSNFMRLAIPLPPLAEQRAIAAILSTWDEAMTLTTRLIEALQRRKQALMQLLLTGEVRFPGFDGAWESVTLDSRFERVERAVENEHENVLSVTATVGFVDQASKFGRVIAGKNLDRYIRLLQGEFAYNKGNSRFYPQGCIYRLDEFDEGAVPNVYYCFRINSDGLNSDFYKHYFENGTLNEQLRPLINAGVRNDGLLNISADSFFKVYPIVKTAK